MAAIVRQVTFRAAPGKGQQLAERLLDAASLVGAAAGCELWLVHGDEDPDIVRVTELWASREQCNATLELDGVHENTQRILELLDESPEVSDGHPLGGARWLSGSTGARAFSILEAQDLSALYGLQDTGESRYIRDELGAAQTGLTHYRLRPSRRQGFAHRHTSVEEIYVVLSGTGRIKVDEQLIPLKPLDAVRVAPASTRELEAGAEGLEVLAFGTHLPGDGESVGDWWKE